MPRARREGFRGVNDCTFAMNGDLYFTDQGQTGLHDPAGRAYRLRAGASQADALVSNVPSPNGLVLTPDGKFVLAVNRYPGSIVSFSRDPVSGKIGKAISSITIPQAVSVVFTEGVP